MAAATNAQKTTVDADVPVARRSQTTEKMPTPKKTMFQDASPDNKLLAAKEKFLNARHRLCCTAADYASLDAVLVLLVVA